MAGGSDGIEPIVAGRKFISATLAEQLATDLIASETRIGRKTVSTYRSRLFQRLNVRTQAGLMRYARDVGSVD